MCVFVESKLFLAKFRRCVCSGIFVSALSTSGVTSSLAIASLTVGQKDINKSFTFSFSKYTILLPATMARISHSPLNQSGAHQVHPPPQPSPLIMETRWVLPGSYFDKKSQLNAAATSSSSDTASAGSTKPPRVKTTAAERQVILEGDIWAANVAPKSVTCVGCKANIMLDQRAEYALTNFNTHKGRCAAVKDTNVRARYYGHHCAVNIDAVICFSDLEGRTGNTVKACARSVFFKP